MAYAKTKAQQVIGAFVIAPYMEVFLFLPNPNWHDSNHLLCMYNPFMPDLVEDPECRFSHDAAHFFEIGQQKIKTK